LSGFVVTVIVPPGPVIGKVGGTVTVKLWPPSPVMPTVTVEGVEPGTLRTPVPLTLTLVAPGAIATDPDPVDGRDTVPNARTPDDVASSIRKTEALTVPEALDGLLPLVRLIVTDSPALDVPDSAPEVSPLMMKSYPR
jgi:hypothetical protein